MNTITYQVKGMHCASCASVIERTMRKLDGISSASANYGTESVSLTFAGEPADPKALARTLEPLGYDLVIPKPVSAAGEPAPAQDDSKVAEVADLLRCWGSEATYNSHDRRPEMSKVIAASG